MCPPDMPLPHNAAAWLLASHTRTLIPTCFFPNYPRHSSTLCHPAPQTPWYRHEKVPHAHLDRHCLHQLKLHTPSTPQVLCYRYRNVPESQQLSDSPPLDHPDVEWVQRMGPDRERVLNPDEVPKVVTSRATAVCKSPMRQLVGSAGSAAAAAWALIGVSCSSASVWPVPRSLSCTSRRPGCDPSMSPGLLLQEVKTPDDGKWQPLQDCPNK